MIIYTIGFSKKNLEEFIYRLQKTGVKKIIDVRLHNTSQLAGYAKKADLKYILNLVGIQYEHHPGLAPTDSLLKDYKNKKITWHEYEREFNNMLSKRKPKPLNPDDHTPTCFLCSEDKPNHCHRRLVAEYFAKHDPNVEIKHL